MRNCISEGTLQAWFDGELAADAAANVAAHLNVCVRCDEAARIVEAESRIVSESLATEFAAAIPTERLRQRIDVAVAALPIMDNRAESRWDGVRGFFSSFRPLAYASVAATILLAAFIGFLYLQKEKPILSPPPNNSPDAFAAAANPSPGAPTKSAVSLLPPTKKLRRLTVTRPGATRESDAMSLSWQERQYDYAITKLNEAIKIQPPLRPSLRVDYEYNMAVADNSIAAGRLAARNNPNDPQATAFMLAAYQSKIDLMNQIANAREPEK
jgi:anti-sigma factor RsiW